MFNKINAAIGTLLFVVCFVEHERATRLEVENKLLKERKCPECPMCPVCPSCYPCPQAGGGDQQGMKTEAEVNKLLNDKELQCVGRVKDAERPVVGHGAPLCAMPGYCNTTGVKESLPERYLYTLRNSLTGVLLGTDSFEPNTGDRLKRTPHDPSKRLVGMDWPASGMTMTGTKRMEALHMLLTDVYLKQKLSGSFLEAGVWRGGSCIYAKGFMEAYNIKDRTVYVVDSFQGLPQKEHPSDARFWSRLNYVAVPQEMVTDHFRRYALLDDRVTFVKGWFGDSLPILAPTLPRLAILRLDGDMYKSTLDVLCNTYPSLQPGGYLIIDDWNIDAAVRAFTAFTEAHNITLMAHPIEGTTMQDPRNNAAYFQKVVDTPLNRAWCDAETRKRA
eukprot:TRINITY_DN42569_c0_g1_i1.p1 TRINITY_DN42569_c0_g1~~TRINITY_DN42569_c0_g1_i1.p1  ORF type:complete len:389 (+),score=44.94 TRINITY_DN42569_c0_g1_i1:28-1194(+)